MRHFTLILVIVALMVTFATASNGTMVYHKFYGNIDTANDSTLSQWKTEITAAKQAKNSQWQVYHNFINDWVDVRDYIAADANIGKDDQERWLDPEVGSTIRAMEQYAKSRRAEAESKKSAAERAQTKLDEAFKIFDALSQDTVAKDSLSLAFKKDYTDYKVRRDNALDRKSVISAFQSKWQSLADSLGAIYAKREEAAKKIEDLKKFAAEIQPYLSLATDPSITKRLTALEETIADQGTTISNLETALNEHIQARKEDAHPNW